MGGSDASVVARSIVEPQAFAVVFGRYFDQIHGYLARRVGRDRADDLAAMTFTVAFERRATFRGQDSASAWLYGIATNLLRNDRRAEQRALLALAQLAHTARGLSAPGPVDRSVLEAVARLDADQRDVLMLHAWEGLSYEEIATALAIPVGTVRSRLARGRQRLRQLLGDTREHIHRGAVNQ